MTRGRDLLQTSPLAQGAARLPAIPRVATGNRAVDQAFAAIKENLDARTNATGNPFERWVTLRDLYEAGVLNDGIPAVTKVPSDAGGFPVWTSRGKYVLVGTVALAALLQEHLNLSSAEVDAADLASLRRSIAAIQPGASLTQVNEAIRRALSGLRAQWAADIARAINTISQRLEEVGSQASAAAAGAGADTDTVNAVTLDLGNTVYSATVTFDAPGVTEEDKILMYPDPSTEHGALGGDELEMDGLTVAAHCRLAGYITAYITAHPGPVSGSRNFLYLVK